MASIETRALSDGTVVHRVRFRHDGKNIARPFDTRETAEAFRGQVAILGAARAIELLADRHASQPAVHRGRLPRARESTSVIVYTAPERDGRTALCLWCPACEDLHRIVTGGANSWIWDGDRERPTISPSILVHATQWAPEFSFHRPNHRVAPGERTTCHSFVVAGQWQFLTDCTHTLAGQTVPCVPIPDGYFALED